MTMDDTEQTIVDEHELDVPNWDRSWNGAPEPGESFVCAVAEALGPDDEIIINDRSRAVTVLGYEEDRSNGLISGSDYPYHILWLRGNGTEYRLRWSHTGDYYPHLNPDSELETTESYSIKHGETRKQTRSTKLGERVRWIRPVGVDEEDVPEWAFSRNIDGLDDCFVDTENESDNHGETA